MKITIHKYFIFFLISILIGCGFQLRGISNNNFDLQEINIISENKYSDLTKNIINNLQSLGVKITSEAKYNLILDNIDSKVRTLSYTNSAKSAEQEIIATINYRIETKDEMVVVRRTATSRKTFNSDNSNLLATEELKNQLLSYH